ncbi:hypothetical protein F7D13_01665 [Methylocystis rosea]|jgi:hypothetical protein|uniref:Cysteine rich repeat-containing protein n=1 Tax=Methylocystis rosea TaxID=173366 RepID=A0ABX6EG36_9HYPH|nr:hypothetical protein [Methylocystis rosea]QGM92827.1 hypothetical protein F7D13_01665 [Methylocystis rosea]
MRKLIPFSFLWAFVAATPAYAQGTSQERSDCMGDAMRFCSSDIPFVDEIESCLQQNIARLSPACRREFAPTQSTKLREEHFQ